MQLGVVGAMAGREGATARSGFGEFRTGVVKVEAWRVLLGVLEGVLLDGVRGIASLLPRGEVNWFIGEAGMWRERGVCGDRRDAF